jgi:serine/threonine protein kinase
MLEGMTSGMQPVEGRLLDNRYRLGSLLGVGGVAEVYRATDERLHRGVAVKLFRGDVADQLHRHEDEMRTLARLNHASLVTVYDTGNDDVTQQPYLVMALVEGSTLADQLQAGRLSPERTAEVGAAVADALAYVHGQGLIHRDVKPANVLISDAGRVFLADFGIARLVDSAHVTQAGDVLGTPAVFAPEQVSGEPVGPPADVYALGLVLLECLTGRREYDGAPLEVAMARLNRQPEIPAGLPPGWRDVLLGMTSRDPATRLSAAQVADRLDRIAAGDSSTQAISMPDSSATTMVMGAPAASATTVMPPAAQPPSSTTTLPDAYRRRRAPRAALVLLGVVIAAAVGVGIYEVQHNRGSSGANCTTATTPQLPGNLESDMQDLERLTCR